MIPFVYDDINDDTRKLLSSFNCGHEGMNNYLVYLAEKHTQQFDATTTLVIHEDNNDLIGYFTLKNTCMMFKPNDKQTEGKPALEIYRLAIDTRYQSKGVGTRILKNIILRTYEYSINFSSAKIIVLQAINNERCLNFYNKSCFKELGQYFEMIYDKECSNTIPMMLNVLNI
jgi:GNAT superfamily N-acetyltransferase